MHLYYFEVEIKEQGSFVVVVLAETDEKAFQYAEEEVERNLLGGYTIEEMALIQRKSAAPGKGYMVAGSSD